MLDRAERTAFPIVLLEGARAVIFVLNGRAWRFSLRNPHVPDEPRCRAANLLPRGDAR